MKKVAILGTAETWKEFPRDDSFEIWALNDMYKIISGCNRWFEMHNTEFIKLWTPSNCTKPHIEFLKELNIPIYMLNSIPELETSVTYPLEKIIEHFGRQYFKSSVDYMIALALYEGFEEIHVYGVNMAVDEEYSYQRPSCEYWLGRAEGMGVKIHLPESCDLLKRYYLYGYKDDEQTAFQTKATAKIESMNTAADEYQKNYYMAMGAKSAWEQIKKESK